MDAIFAPPSPDEISTLLQARMKSRLTDLDDDAVYRYLADAVYLERKRFKGNLDDRESKLIESGARALRVGRDDQVSSMLALVDSYAREIHNPFSGRTYDVAKRVLPAALSRLLTAAAPKDLMGQFDPKSRIVVSGEKDLCAKLSKDKVLILAPTHVSNLDSPLIGVALNDAKLPPFIYGAGLNLFSNPAMAFFMSRLGAYTVDRRKKHTIYKDVLKDYSVDSLRRRCHSLFYPGGTRSRSGRIETRLKKGLLGTGIEAWQDSLADGKPSDVLVVPCTLSMALVLEAETLIQDSLAEEGKSRFIISDDEFSDGRAVASFTTRVLQLDASVHIRLGRPLDLVGNPVDDAGVSIGPNGKAIDREGYVRNKSGELVRDRQRDMIYTQRLSEAICGAYQRDNTVLSTQLVASVAWSMLRDLHPRLDVFQTVLLSPSERLLDRTTLLKGIETKVAALEKAQSAGKIHTALPSGGPKAILADAFDKFDRFHTRKALTSEGPNIAMDPQLCLYYGNRLAGFKGDA